MPKLSPVHYTILVCVFERAAFQRVREESSHLVLTKRGILRPVVIPKYQEVPVFIIKNNLRTAAISRERYFELLEECR